MQSYFHYCTIMNVTHSPPKPYRKKLTLSEQHMADTQTFLSRPSARIANPNEDLKNAYSKDFFKQERFEHMHYLRRLRNKAEDDSVASEISDDEEFKLQSSSRRKSSRLVQNAHIGLSTTVIQPNRKMQAQSNMASQKQHMTQFIKIQTDSDSLPNPQVEEPVVRKRGRPKGSGNKNKITREAVYNTIQQQLQINIQDNKNQDQVLQEQTEHHSQREQEIGGGQQEQKKVGKKNGMRLRNQGGKKIKNSKRQRKQPVEQVKQICNKTADDGNQLYEYQEISSDVGQQQRVERDTQQATQSLPKEPQKLSQLPKQPSSIKPSALKEAQTNEVENLDNTLSVSKDSTVSLSNIKTPEQLLIEPTLIQFSTPKSKNHKLRINSSIYSESLVCSAPPDQFTSALFKGWTNYYHKFTQAIALQLAQEEEEQQLQPDSKNKRPKQTTFSRYRKVLTVAEEKSERPSNSARKKGSEPVKRVSQDRRRSKRNLKKKCKISYK